MKFWLTVGLTKTELNLCGGGIFSLMPSLGGSDCDRRWPYRCGGSAGLAGDRGYFRSCSGRYVVIVTKPVIRPALPEFDCSGIRRRGVSWIAPRVISADPNGTAVCETFSRTSYTVKRTKEFLFRPSPDRNIIVHRYWGFEHLCKAIEHLLMQREVFLHQLMIHYLNDFSASVANP